MKRIFRNAMKMCYNIGVSILFFLFVLYAILTDQTDLVNDTDYHPD